MATGLVSNVPQCLTPLFIATASQLYKNIWSDPPGSDLLLQTTEAPEAVQVVQLHQHIKNTKQKKQQFIIWAHVMASQWWFQHELGLFTAL